MLHNYRSRQVHEILSGVNPSSSFRDMHSAKSGPNLWQIWQVFGPWASPYEANGQMTMTVHYYRPRQFHRTYIGENPSSRYRDIGSACLAAALLAASPPAQTVTTIALQPERLRGKKMMTITLPLKQPWNILLALGNVLFPRLIRHVSLIGTVNYSQKHGSRAGEANKTTGSGYRSALAAGCSLLTALYIWT